MNGNKNKQRKINPENKNFVIAKKVCGTIICQFKETLSHRGHLETTALVNTENFCYYYLK